MSDPFNFSTGLGDSAIIEDSAFDSFADFGDFQSASSDDFGTDRSLTPTGADSWSFASTSSAGSLDDGSTSSDRDTNLDSDERTARQN